MMSDLVKSVVYAFRGLRKSPGFALAALLILTLGIGANTAIFSVVNAVLLRPLPFADSDSIVSVVHVPPEKAFPGTKTFAVSAANFLDWRKQNDVFSSMALVGGRNLRMSGGGMRPTAVRATTTEPEFFTVLGMSPAVGRIFSADECQPGRDTVVIVSDRFAQEHFGSAREAVGRKILFNERTYEVIGVMPAQFRVPSWFPAANDALIPIAWTPEMRATRGNHNFTSIARLKNGVTVEQAQSQMNVISDRLAREYPEEDTGWGASVNTLRNVLVGDVRPALLTLLGAVTFVLLIACANTGNLMLARTIARRKELAIRAALGASTGQILRPVLMETTLLSLIGGGIGLLLARGGQALVIGALEEQLPQATTVQLDGRVLAFTFVVAVLTGIMSGLIASWRLTQENVNESLKQGLSKTDAASGGQSTRNVLVVAEVALSLILLVGAGLMIRSLWALRSVNPGFDSSHVVTMAVPIPPTATGSGRNRFYDDFLAKVNALPGVTSAAAVDTLPLAGGGSQQPIVVEGRPAEVFALQPNVAVRRATPGYLKTMHIPLMAGREFEQADVNGKRAYVVISQTMARQFWPGENPIGKKFRISFTPMIVREVIGVAGDVKESGLDVLESLAMLYEPQPLDDSGYTSLVVRATGDPMALVSPVRQVMQEINPALPVRRAISLEQLVDSSLSQHRFSMFLFAALAGLAFLLAAIGIYSVLAYSVRRRSQEISIRMALGAQTRDVVRLVVTEGMKPTLLGVAIGAFGAYALSGILSRLIFGVSATDPYTFAVVAALLASVAFLACLLPAFRATRVEPVKALRGE